MRKKIAAIALPVILISLLALGSAAYMTVDGNVTNVVTTGGIAMSVDGSGPWTYREGVYTLDGNIMPGQAAEKSVTVKNDGDSAAFYARVGVDINIVDAQGNAMPDDYDVYVDLNFNSADWTYNAGWWYFNEAVEAGGESEAVFTHILLSPNSPNEMKKAQVTVAVNAQAVQAKNNPIPEGGSVAFDSAGWPDA